MNTRNAEDLLRETLQVKASESYVDLSLDDIRILAGARQHRSAWRTVGVVAAAAALAVGIPTALYLRPADDRTGPTNPSPTPTVQPSPTPTEPTRPAEGDLQKLPTSAPPGITYLHDGTVYSSDGSTTRLPDPTAPVSAFTSYHGGWLVGVGGGEDRVRWYDNTGARKSDGPGVGIFAVSDDGTLTAYAQSGEIHIGNTPGMGEGEQTVSGDAHQLWPVGFLRGGALVYEAGEGTVAVQGGSTLPGMNIARAVSAEADLVAGDDHDGNTLVLTGAGEVAWTSTTWAVWSFSPDGRYAAATNVPTGGDVSSVAILDARTGVVIAQHDVLGDGISVMDPVMDVDGTLLAAATTGDLQQQTVLRLDRDGNLTRATEVFPLAPASDSDHVVFATRP